MNEERLNELFNIVNEGYSSIQEREIRDYITNLQQENRQLKEVIDKAINWTIKYQTEWCQEDEVIRDLKQLLDILKRCQNE